MYQVVGLCKGTLVPVPLPTNTITCNRSNRPRVYNKLHNLNHAVYKYKRGPYQDKMVFSIDYL